MFIPDIWPISSLLVGTAVAVAAYPVQAVENYALGMCQVSQPGTGAEIRPTYDGDIYLYDYHRGDPRYQGFTFDDNSVNVTLVKAPAHGKVDHVESTISNNYYHYYSKEGYYGQDTFVMQVEKNGVKVRIEYLIEVARRDESTTYLCNPEQWKISLNKLGVNWGRTTFPSKPGIRHCPERRPSACASGNRRLHELSAEARQQRPRVPAPARSTL